MYTNTEKDYEFSKKKSYRPDCAAYFIVGSFAEEQQVQKI